MDKVKAVFSVIGDTVKKHLKLIIALIAIIVIAVVVCNVFLGSPKKTVKQMGKAIEKSDSSKVLDLIDLKGLYVFMNKCNGSDKKFDDKYKDFEENDKYDDFVEDFSEDKIDELFEKMDDEGISISLDEIKSVEKSKNSKKLYKVKAKFKVETEDDDETVTVTIYVMKSGLSYKVVGLDTEDLASMMLSSYSDYSDYLD